jgi:hypothetical protein
MVYTIPASMHDTQSPIFKIGVCTVFLTFVKVVTPIPITTPINRVGTPSGPWSYVILGEVTENNIIVVTLTLCLENREHIAVRH